MIKTIYHGSSKILRIPQYGIGNPYNDFGLGFYCTESCELGEEWSGSGFINTYKLEMRGLRTLDLCGSQFTVLHWLSILLENRAFDLFTSSSHRASDYIQSNFEVDVKGYDAITGYRADNSNFAIAQSFLNDEIGYKVFRNLLVFGETGKQFVVKSRRAYDRLLFNGYELVNDASAYRHAIAKDVKVMENLTASKNLQNKSDDLYISQFIKEGINQYDSRLR